MSRRAKWPRGSTVVEMFTWTRGMEFYQLCGMRDRGVFVVSIDEPRWRGWVHYNSVRPVDPAAREFLRIAKAGAR